MMEYKGYTAKVEFDDKAEIFHGEVIGIKDVVTFQGRTAKELKKAFRESVDDYLAFCKERGESPDKPFTGKFVVRLSPELHRKIYLSAKFSNESINAWLNEKLSRAVDEELKECGRN
ncbi:MAG: type II toxin-antitoxin system HicB family antitoxin [Nitrospirae bacterium]|nr:type II toxin-antitoxin system HicB family antitoxin [Nitrospirota bacterium]MCL5237074.1 type II toxin-antitoxin system HicB family antitoxin [Nitrospirota bacterium]